MEKKQSDFIIQLLLWGVFAATNLFFVVKFVPRAGISPIWGGIAYSIFAVVWILFGYRLLPRLTENKCKYIGISLLVCICAAIILSLIVIPPLSVRVDRWSATTYFLDALFQGEYPYAVHTHVSENNYSSPFPFWHYLNIPFWLSGDVGIGLIAFLVLTVVCIWSYSPSHKVVLMFLWLLVCSPAYWWEVAVRSDGLSNALLVLSVILLLERYSIRLDNHWGWVAVIAGCLAVTRLSAVIPVALYLFYPYLKCNQKIQLLFPVVVLGVVLLFFIPYIFWDTDNWIFFRRNPFMSQTSPGNMWILLIMVIAAILIAGRKKTFEQYLSSTGLFMFCFMLFTQFGVIYMSAEPITLFSPQCDISYFTLSLPYCLLYLSLREIGKNK